MTNELTIEQLCLYMRNGIEIWLQKDKAERFGDDLNNETAGKFNRIEGRIVNTADIVGIFTPQDLEELKRRKLGQHKCKYGNWHLKDEVCGCAQELRIREENQKAESRREIVKISPEKLEENLSKIRQTLKSKGLKCGQ